MADALLPDPGGTGPEFPSGTRLGGRLDDFLAVFGEPLDERAEERGFTLRFVTGPEPKSPILTALFDHGRAVHLAWQPHGPMRSAILSRVEMLKRWPDDAVPEGPFTLRSYESSMNRVRSRLLARALPIAWFVDGNGSLVEPGIFTCLATRAGWVLSAGGRLLSPLAPPAAPHP